MKEKVLEVLTEDWQSQKDILATLEDPKPSGGHLGHILRSLGESGEAERNPPMSEGSKPGKTYKWRLKPHLKRTDLIVRGEVDQDITPVETPAAPEVPTGTQLVVSNPDPINEGVAERDETEDEDPLDLIHEEPKEPGAFGDSPHLSLLPT